MFLIDLLNFRLFVTWLWDLIDDHYFPHLLISLYFYFLSVDNWTHCDVHAKQAHYHWATPLSSLLMLLNKTRSFRDLSSYPHGTPMGEPLMASEVTITPCLSWHHALLSFTFSEQSFSLSHGIMCWWLLHLWYHLTPYIHPECLTLVSACPPGIFSGVSPEKTPPTSPFSAPCPLKWPSPTSHLMLPPRCQSLSSFDIGNPELKAVQACIPQPISVTLIQTTTTTKFSSRIHLQPTLLHPHRVSRAFDPIRNISY